MRSVKPYNEVLRGEELLDLVKRVVGIDGLDFDELKTLEYFVKNLSVGELIALIDLEKIVGIKDPDRVIRSLIDKGLIVRGEGCYNLSPKLKNTLYAKSIPTKL